MHLNWGGLYGTLCRVIKKYSLLSNLYCEIWIEHTEVSSSRSTEEVYESRWRKGLDGCYQTDAIYLIFKDGSCSKEVIYLKVGWKLRIKGKNA